MSLNLLTSVTVVVSAWLIVCAVFDWRTREVPVPLTVVPLIASVFWAVIVGSAPAGFLAVMMLFVSGFKKTGPAMAFSTLSLAFAIILSFLFSPNVIENTFPLFIIYGYTLLWYFGKTGGADVKILTTLTLLFGTTAFVYAVVAGGIAGIIGIIKKQKHIPLVVPIAIGTIAYFIVRTV